MTTMNKQWHLVSRPSGEPTPDNFKLVELPMPRPCYSGKQRLPATYANFLVLNKAVLMPAFRQPQPHPGYGLRPGD